jgi:hypothetical protein
VKGEWGSIWKNANVGDFQLQSRYSSEETNKTHEMLTSV